MLTAFITINTLAWIGLVITLNIGYRKAYKTGVSAGYLIGCYRQDPDVDKHLRSKEYLKPAYQHIDHLKGKIDRVLVSISADELV